MHPEDEADVARDKEGRYVPMTAFCVVTAFLIVVTVGLLYCIVSCT